MAYESRLYIVEKYDSHIENSKKYGQVIAMYDMCKFHAFDGIFKNETDCYIFADDGNTKIEIDMYGEPLKEATVKEVIDYLDDYKKEGEYYRRVEPLLGLLKGFNLDDWDNLVVLHYGY